MWQQTSNKPLPMLCIWDLKSELVHQHLEPLVKVPNKLSLLLLCLLNLNATLRFEFWILEHFKQCLLNICQHPPSP